MENVAKQKHFYGMGLKLIFYKEEIKGNFQRDR